MNSLIVPHSVDVTSFMLQTRSMTGMDVWMIICMIFVALAKFEYAVQLKNIFGTADKIGNANEKGDKTKTAEKSRKIDRYALVVIFPAYILTAVGYFYYYWLH